MVKCLRDWAGAKKALQLASKLYPLFKDLFIETNPVPVKAALAMLGLIAEEYRLPLVQMSDRQPCHAESGVLKASGILK
jgi:4-hydroxy-tetrahydrodipicolinate synthase